MSHPVGRARLRRRGARFICEESFLLWLDGVSPYRRIAFGAAQCLTTTPAEGIAAMSAAAANGALAAGGGFRLEEDGVDVGKILQLQTRNFLPDETLDRLQATAVLRRSSG